MRAEKEVLSELDTRKHRDRRILEVLLATSLAGKHKLRVQRDAALKE